MTEKWETFDNILKDEALSMKEEASSESTAVATIDNFGEALEKAKQLINISNTTDVPSLIQKMKEQFVTNRLETATKGEKAVNMALTRLIEKLNSEDMPVNTLLKILTQLRDSSQQDMTAVLGVPNPNDKNKGGAVINILNNNSGGNPQAQEISPVVATSQIDASSDVSKFLEVSTLALDNIRNGKVNASDDLKSKVMDAEFSEVVNNESK